MDPNLRSPGGLILTHTDIDQPLFIDMRVEALPVRNPHNQERPHTNKQGLLIRGQHYRENNRLLPNESIGTQKKSNPVRLPLEGFSPKV